MDDMPSLQKARDFELNEWRTAMLKWQQDCEKYVLSLRDQFAASALTGLLASDQYDRLVTAADYADAAYEMADAMLAAREAK